MREVDQYQERGAYLKHTAALLLPSRCPGTMVWRMEFSASICGLSCYGGLRWFLGFSHMFLVPSFIIVSGLLAMQNRAREVVWFEVEFHGSGRSRPIGRHGLAAARCHKACHMFELCEPTIRMPALHVKSRSTVVHVLYMYSWCLAPQGIRSYLLECGLNP